MGKAKDKKSSKESDLETVSEDALGRPTDAGNGGHGEDKEMKEIMIYLHGNMMGRYSSSQAVSKKNAWVWVNYNELTTSSLEIIVSKGNHPQMALIQVSELL